MKTLLIILFLIYALFKIEAYGQTWTPSERSHFGMNGFETANPFRLTTLQLDSAYRWEAMGIRNMNIAWNRTLSPMGGQFRWEFIEPIPGTYDWARPDSFVKRIQAENLQLLVLVHPFTPWDQPGKNNGNYNKPNNMTAFKRFIAKLVERYDGDGINDMPGLLYPIKYYEIGNEPEGLTFGDSPGTYDDFMTTVKAAYDTAKVAYPDVKIVIGGASPIYDSRGFANQIDLFWKGAFNRANVANYFDIFNFHFFVGQYTKDIKDYLDYWKNLLSMYGLSGKEIWLTETGTYSGTSTGPDGQPWPDQSSEYQASWWVKQSTYCLANGISKFFWVFYYSDQSDWRSTVAFVDIDRTTKKAVYYTHKLLAEKLDAFSTSIQNSYSASAQNQTAGNFRFTVNGKPVYVIWNDAGGNETLTGFTSTRVKVTKAVPVLDSNGSVVLDAYGNPTFETSIVNVLNGQISLTLSSVPIYIEEIENAPATPTLISPADGAMGVSTSLSLVWNRSSGAMNYRVQLSTTPNFLSIIDDSTLTDTFKQVGPLQNGTTYYWRVSATNTGGTSNWSSTWSFTTIVAAPMAPSLVSPLNGSTGVDTNPTLIWNSSTGATSYRLQVSTNSSFTSLVYDQSGITDTTHQVTGLANNTLYYWRVNATNAGGTSSYSAIWSFTTIIAAPMAPSLVSPLNGSTGVDINPTLIWNSSTGATSYRLQISTNSSFISLVYDQNGITDTTHQVTGLANNTLYYWRVNATNAGGTSSYSAIWSFTTIIAAPMAPSLVSPLNGSTGVDINPTLIWNSSTGATSYRLQISTNSSFISLVYDQNGITDTTHQVTGLANNTLYYWRVNATNAGGTSSYSAIWSFTTIGPMSVEQIGLDIPTAYALYQNYPNPFNLGTTIQFSIAEHGNVSLVIFNSLGMKIAILFDDYLPAGYYRIHWFASGISSGVYFYQLRTSGFTQTKKLLLLR